jgi:alkyldihydroxyacetonephosphate synthase
VATRSAGQLSTGVGAIADLVVGLRCVAPSGEIVIPPMPPSSEGPDLRELVLGSEGRFGVITDVSLRVRPLPEAADRNAWLFGSFAEGLAAVRAALQDGAAPHLVRLSDEAETTLLANTSGALLITGLEGTTADVARDRAGLAAIGAGARALGPEPAARWYETRYDAPYLRDALLERGVLADSLETATLWSNAETVHRAVRDALRAALDPAGRALVLCHVSHAYATGASLYFTFVAPGGGDALERWWSAKRAALDAMLATGAVVSHHHGIGRDHREWQARRLGPTAVSAIDAVAGVLDPGRVLAANR